LHTNDKLAALVPRQEPHSTTSPLSDFGNFSSSSASKRFCSKFVPPDLLLTLFRIFQNSLNFWVFETPY
jgi:hypothetical protein